MNIIGLKALAIAAVLVGATGATAPANAPQTAPQAKTCLFFENFDYGGASFGLYSGDLLVTNANVSPDGVYRGTFKGRKFVAPEWAGRVSSLKVPKNCTAYVMDATTLPRAELSVDLRAFTDRFNDKSVSFGCSCK